MNKNFQCSLNAHKSYTHLVGEQKTLHERLRGASREGKLADHHNHHTVVGGLLGVNVTIGQIHLGVLQVQGADGSSDGLRAVAAHTIGLLKREKSNTKFKTKYVNQMWILQQANKLWCKLLHCAEASCRPLNKQHM